MEEHDFPELKERCRFPDALTRLRKGLGPTSAVILALALQFLAALTLSSWNYKPDGSLPASAECLAVVIFIQLLVWFLVFLSCLSFYKNFWFSSVRSVWSLYFLKVIAFSGLYLSIYISIRNAFNLPVVLKQGEDCPGDATSCEVDVVPGNDYELYCSLLYFATFTQTLVGVGDIGPNHWSVMILACTQMLIGLVYHVFIISLLVQKSTMKLPRLVQDKESRFRVIQVLNEVFQKIKHCKCVLKIRRWCRKWLFFVVLLIQVLIYVIVSTSIDPHDVFSEKPLARFLFLFLILLNLLQIMAVIITSMKFIKKASEVSIPFLCQSYISVIMIYASIYLIVALVTTDHPAFTVTTHLDSEWEDVPALLEKFFYFSFTLSTACGNPYPILPSRWMSYIVCISQMLIGTFYNVVILGIAMVKLAVKARENIHKIYEMEGQRIESDSTKKLLEASIQVPQNPFLPIPMETFNQNFELL